VFGCGKLIKYACAFQPPAVDSWEEAADGDDLAEEELEEGEDGEEAVIKPKKRIAKTEETKSKKEHVNVVFIGHVGQYPKMNIKFLFMQYAILLCNAICSPNIVRIIG
jgi:hypothetical protein